MLEKKFKDKRFIFIFAFIVEFIFYYLFEHLPIGGEYIVPDVAIAPVFGMMFGPIGGLGQALASLIWQLYEGLDPIASLIDFTIMLVISIVAYKLWYTTFTKRKINTPKFNSTYNVFKFLCITVLISLVYWALIHISLEVYPNMHVIYPLSSIINRTSYALNMFSFTLIIGLLLISIFNIKGLPMQTPKNWLNIININNKYLLISFIVLMTYLILVQIFAIDNDFTDHIFFGLTLITIILFCLNKFEANIEVRIVDYSIIEKIILFFLIVLAILLVTLYEDITLVSYMFTNYYEGYYLELITLSVGSTLMIMFCILHIHYVEKTMSSPIYDLIDSTNYYSQNKEFNSYEKFNTDFEKYLKNNDDMSRLVESFISLNNNIRNNLNNIKRTTAEKEKIETEFNIASNIQSGMIKTNFDEFSKGKPFEIYGFMKPAKEVGGDFYDYFNMGEENMAFVIGDVSGKGVPATLVMVKTMQLIENHSIFDSNIEELYENVNNLSYRQDDEDLIVTSWFGKLHLDSGKLSFINAGHNPPLIKQDNKDFEYLKIQPDTALGINENSHYKKYEIDLTPGDMIFLYTNGITEANNNHDDFYGEGRLQKTINAYKDEKLEKIIENIKNDLYQFCDYSQSDDITMLIIKYNGCESDE